MPIIRYFLISILSFIIILGGSLTKCEAGQLDSLRIIVIDFNSENVDQNFINKIPWLLEQEIAKDKRFFTLKRDTSKQREKIFQYKFESSSFDTLILNKLREHRQIDIVILGKIIQSSDTVFIYTKSLALKNYTILDSSSILLPTENIDEQLGNQLSELASLIRKNIINSISPKDITNMFSIVFTPFPANDLDSLLKIQTNSFIEQAIKTLNSRELETRECLITYFKTTDSNKIIINSDSLARSIGKQAEADLMVWWSNCEVNDNLLHFQPVITVINSVNLKLTNNRQQDILTSALGQLDLLKLPQQTDFNIQPLVDFLLGFYFFKHGEFTSAINLFKKIDQELSPTNFFINYYLADSHVRRGKMNITDITSAKADWETASNYYQKCLNDSNSINNKEILVWIFNNLGVVTQLQGDFNNALHLFKKSLNKKKGMEIDGSIIRIYNNIGNIYLFKGEWKEALEIFQTSIVTMEQLDDRKNLAITYDNMGNIYQLIMQRSNAITYYQKSLSIRKELGDELGVADSYSNLGDVYLYKKDYAQAFDNYQHELGINERLHNEPRIARCYDKLGSVYHKKGELDSAIVYFQKSLELLEMIGNESGIVSVSNHLATVYYKQKNTEKSLALYEKSLALAEQRNDEISLARIYDHIADIYNSEQQWEEALEYYEKSAEFHEKLNYHESLALILYNMGLIHLKQNRYSKGYQLMIRAIEIDEQHGFNNLQNEKKFIQNIETLIETGNN